MHATKERRHTLIRRGVNRLDRSFLCTQRKLISTMLLVLLLMRMVAGTAAVQVTSAAATGLRCRSYCRMQGIHWLRGVIVVCHIAMHSVGIEFLTSNTRNT